MIDYNDDMLYNDSGLEEIEDLSELAEKLVSGMIKKSTFREMVKIKARRLLAKNERSENEFDYWL